MVKTSATCKCGAVYVNEQVLAAHIQAMEQRHAEAKSNMEPKSRDNPNGREDHGVA